MIIPNDYYTNDFNSVLIITQMISLFTLILFSMVSSRLIWPDYYYFCGQKSILWWFQNYLKYKSEWFWNHFISNWKVFKSIWIVFRNDLLMISKVFEYITEIISGWILLIISEIFHVYFNTSLWLFLCLLYFWLQLNLTKDLCYFSEKKSGWLGC